MMPIMHDTTAHDMGTQLQQSADAEDKGEHTV
jgi:hypothetical protein